MVTAFSIVPFCLMIAFSFQEVDQVPTHSGDVPVDWIVTDKEITEV